MTSFYFNWYRKVYQVIKKQSLVLFIIIIIIM
nr:MAG TPA: hypothetical protein [Caudoviricetes sp.]